MDEQFWKVYGRFKQQLAEMDRPKPKTQSEFIALIREEKKMKQGEFLATVFTNKIALEQEILSEIQTELEATRNNIIRLISQMPS